MLLKKYSNFISENQGERPWISNNFKVTEHMVSNGKLIQDLIPDETIKNFDCSNLGLTTLEGCPKEVQYNFYCFNNRLTSLVDDINDPYCPSALAGTFDCSSNFLTSLEGCPIKILKHFRCGNNKTDLIIERKFIISTYYTNQETYWPDLLQYMLDEKIDLNKVYGWPNDFIETLDDYHQNLFKSFKGISKFNI